MHSCQAFLRPGQANCLTDDKDSMETWHDQNYGTKSLQKLLSTMLEHHRNAAPPTASVAFPSNLTKHGRLAMSYVDIKTFSDVGQSMKG